MKAIVLTYDKHIKLAEMLYRKYMELWKECPFQFLIPCNNPQSKEFGFVQNRGNISIIPCNKDIRSTMNMLLRDIEDQEWVFWCISDRYPLRIGDEVKAIYKSIKNSEFNVFNGVRLIFWGENLSRNDPYNFFRLEFREIYPDNMQGFWHHQFLKAFVLKEAFLSNDLNSKYSVRELNSFYKDKPYVPFLENILVPARNIVTFGESTINGCITANAKKEINKYGIIDLSVDIERNNLFIEYNRTKISQLSKKIKSKARSILSHDIDRT